jgi:hypothetical protein
MVDLLGAGVRLVVDADKKRVNFHHRDGWDANDAADGTQEDEYQQQRAETATAHE